MSSETTTGPSDTTKDSCDMGVKQIFEEGGRASIGRANAFCNEVFCKNLMHSFVYVFTSRRK